MRRAYFLLGLAVLGVPGLAAGQTSLIAGSRVINWTNAGAVGGIPNRTTICATLNPGATGAQINSAISSCGNDQVVKLNAGTFNISGGIVFNAKNNVTLRGAGPNQTFLVFSSGHGCGGISGNVCTINAAPQYSDGTSNNASWTAGYAKGATSITLASVPNLKIGSLLILDQLEDTGDGDNGNTYVCNGTGVCSQSGGGEPGRQNRPQQQHVTVTSISGSGPYTVGITPGLYMPNWRAAKSPGAWWSSALPISGVGIEDLSIMSGGSGANNSIAMYNTTNSWVKNVRSVRPGHQHILFYQSVHVTIRDSYFFDGQNHAQQSYGTSCYQCGDLLVENNIFQWVTNPMQNETAQGSVYSYNFSINGQFGPGTWMQASSSNHDSGTNFLLFEGNDGVGLQLDNYFGQAFFVTGFRNRWTGWEAQPAVLNNQTVPVHVYALSRYTNIIGNVLGWSGYHSKYETNPGNLSSCNRSIFALGLGSNCSTGGSSPFPPNDPLTVSTLMRWGNWDTVSNASRFVAAEVPSGLSLYANPVPPDQNLPASLYRPSRPSWWGSMPWPAIGPDVTGGNVPNTGGKAYRIPARVCFEDVMGGQFGDTTARTFNAANCYAGGGYETAPGAPSNVRIIRAAAWLLPLFVPVYHVARRRRQDGRA